MQRRSLDRLFSLGSDATLDLGTSDGTLQTERPLARPRLDRDPGADLLTMETYTETSGDGGKREADAVSHAGRMEKGTEQGPGFPSRMNKGQGPTLDQRSRARAHLRAYARPRSFPGRPGPGITVALISDKGKPRGGLSSRGFPQAQANSSHSVRGTQKTCACDLFFHKPSSSRQMAFYRLLASLIQPPLVKSFFTSSPSQRSLDALPYLIRVGV
jgi:hypothetical protein